MYRGQRLFICTKCGNRFWGMDIELMATVYSAPLTCPKCGSIRTRPVSLMPRAANKVYEVIWKRLEEDKNKDSNE
jgi:DNA-directed RNA polymerase subunit RPC12/RpoP